MAIAFTTDSSESSDPTSRAGTRSRRCWRRRSARSSPRGARAPASSTRRMTPSAGSAQLRSGFIAVKAQRLHHRRVAEAEQEGWAVAAVDVLAESPGRHCEYVLVFPVE